MYIYTILLDKVYQFIRKILSRQNDLLQTINMIKVVIFMAFVAVVYSKPVNPDDIASSCMLLNDLEDQSMDALMSRLVFEKGLTYNEKCYFKCLNEKSHKMDEEGNFTPMEGIKYETAQRNTHLSEHQLEAVVDMMSDCGHNYIIDHCERAAKISKCFHDALFYFFFL